jgi:hypothetical protein
MKRHEIPPIIVGDSKNWKVAAINELKDKGVVVLRGLESEKTLDIINNKVKSVLSNPALLGSIGYYQKDPYKKMYDGFLLGKEVVNFVANENLLDVIEGYINEKVILNEIFLKYDLGSNLTYFPYHRHTGTDVEGSIDKPFGCGGMIYLHDTNDGAFCYSYYSHKLPISRGAESLISKHNKKGELIQNLHKIIGMKGDLVLFDERGFHGPEQPCSISRKVLLFGYQSKLSTSNRSRSGTPIVISDMISLNKRQLEAIGLGGGTRKSFNEYHIRKSVLKTKNYKLFTSIITRILSIQLSFTKLKNLLKRS